MPASLVVGLSSLHIALQVYVSTICRVAVLPTKLCLAWQQYQAALSSCAWAARHISAWHHSGCMARLLQLPCHIISHLQSLLQGPSLCLFKVTHAAEPCPLVCSPMTRVYRVLRAAYQARWHKWRAGKQRTAHTSGYTGKQGVQLTRADRGATAEDQHQVTCHLTVHHRGCAELKLSLADAARARAALKLMSCGTRCFGLVTSWLLRLVQPGNRWKDQESHMPSMALHAVLSGKPTTAVEGLLPAGLLADVDCLLVMQTALDSCTWPSSAY